LGDQSLNLTKIGNAEEVKELILKPSGSLPNLQEEILKRLGCPPRLRIDNRKNVLDRTDINGARDHQNASLTVAY
jgi:hypothetical protein